jgi:hypothetical protein
MHPSVVLVKRLSTRKSQTHVVNEFTEHLDVVSWHHELLVRTLGLRRESESDGHIRRADEQLGTVVGHEGRVATTLILGQYLGCNVSA